MLLNILTDCIYWRRAAVIVTDCNCAHMEECIFVIKCVHFYR